MRILQAGMIAVLAVELAGMAWAAPATSPASQEPIVIPEKVWIVLPLPTEGKGIARMDKHVSLAFSPLNNRVYFTGGDYLGQSYRQETWSLDVADRLRDRNNVSAGWRLEYPYCGPQGSPQPKGPDHVGWTWDSRRNIFWLVPGEMQPHGKYSQRCPGERPDYYGDEDGTQGPKLLFRHIMTFDPKTMTWADYDANANGPGSNTWYSVYDPVTDTLIRPSPNYTMGVYDIKAKRWVNYPLGPNANGQDPNVQTVHYATDYEKRRVFMIDGARGRLHRWNMDAHTLSDLGPIPNGPLVAGSSILSDKGYSVWDSNAKVLIHYRFRGQGVFVYHPDEKPPRWEAADFPLAPGSPPDLKVHWNGVAFDPVNNVVVGIGGEGSDYIWLLRYGPTSDRR
jgi:hypothetical protein